MGWLLSLIRRLGQWDSYGLALQANTEARKSLSRELALYRSRTAEEAP